MEFKKTKILISLICAVFGAIHLFAPGITIDAITLGLIGLGLLPWFQPLVKSLELPGGLKIELQDVKAATDKISGVAAMPEELAAQEKGSVSFIAKVAEQDPNLALVGLRIEIEKLLVEIAEANRIPIDRRGVGALLDELKLRNVIPKAMTTGLKELIALGNQAAHGATVSKDAASWALEIAPQLLALLSTLRSKVVKPAVIRGEISKSQILAAFETKTPILVRYPQPFAIPPNVSIGFYGHVDDEMASGSLQVVDADEKGFAVNVVTMPAAHSVSIWTVKWKATGPTAITGGSDEAAGVTG